LQWKALNLGTSVTRTRPTPKKHSSLATIALAASAARGLVAFAAWRKSFRDRLIGAEPYSGEVF
jgi:hypothetical protein